MNIVYIVDRDAKELAAEFNAIARRDGHAVQYRAAQTPERLFEEMDNAQPRLILLHHTWTGYTIESLLDRIRKKTADVRVVIFTGRELNMPELIECIRNGACDYWQKSGAVDTMAWARQIVTYCDSEMFTLERLSRPSRTVISLLSMAESNLSEVSSLRSQVEVLEQKLAAEKGGVNRDVVLAVVRVCEIVVYLFVLALVFISVSHYTSQWAAGGLVILFAVFFLFLHGRIEMAWLDWRQGKAKIQGAQSPRPESSGN